MSDIKLGNFDKWFTHYLLHNTDSCLDRDIFRWAKPVLRYGYETQCLTDLEFKGSQKLIDESFEAVKLQSQLDQLQKQNEILKEFFTNEKNFERRTVGHEMYGVSSVEMTYEKSCEFIKALEQCKELNRDGTGE